MGKREPQDVIDASIREGTDILDFTGMQESSWPINQRVRLHHMPYRLIFGQIKPPHQLVPNTKTIILTKTLFQVLTTLQLSSSDE